MSPRRKFGQDEGPLLVAQPWQPGRWSHLRSRLRKPPRLSGLPLVSTLTAMVMAAAVTVCALMLVPHIRNEQRAAKDLAVLSYVRFFITEFTSLDPFHANDYVEGVLAQATGDFEKQYHENANEILLDVARSERSTGTVLDAGVERWNDDGSVNVLVAVNVTTKSPDGKQVFDSTNRWVATAEQEGSQWKISNLLQVI